MRTDLLTNNNGSIITISAQSVKGRRWMKQYVGDGEPHQICDHRMGIDIMYGALEAGLVLEDGASGAQAKGLPDHE